MLSFIDSPFTTKALYNAWLALPAEKQPAALDRAETQAACAAKAYAPPKTDTYEPLSFPEERVAKIKAAFDELSAGKRLPLKAVHRLLFTDEERSEYDFDTWDTDLQATCEGCKKDMSWDDVNKFLTENL